RLREFPTLRQYAKEQKWDCGEGFIEAQPKEDSSGRKAKQLFQASHLTGKPLVPSDALTSSGFINREAISTVKTALFKTAYTEARYKSPIVLVHQQFDLNHGYFGKGYWTYKNQIVGFPGAEESDVEAVSDFLRLNKRALQAFVAGISV